MINTLQMQNKLNKDVKKVVKSVMSVQNHGSSHFSNDMPPHLLKLL